MTDWKSRIQPYFLKFPDGSEQKIFAVTCGLCRRKWTCPTEREALDSLEKHIDNECRMAKALKIIDSEERS